MGSDKTDKRVGRVESGWSRIDDGGICPDITAFPPNERDAFNVFSVNLLGSANIDDQTRHCLSCVLLLHFKEVKESYPQHRLIAKMMSSVQQCGLTVATLETWADHAKTQFHLDNAVFLPTDDLEPGGRIRVRDVS